MAKVKIINDPANKVCRCGSWFDHYKRFSGVHIRMCGVMECNGFDMIGARVKKADSEDEKIYIIPICSVHIGSTEELEIYDSIPLVSSDIKTTCGTETAIYLKEGER